MAQKQIPPTQKIWKASKDSDSGFEVSISKATVRGGDKRKFVMVDDKGVYLSGPVSIITTSENIRHAGMWVKGNDFLQMIPSTIVSPQPMNWLIPPVHGVTAMADMVSYFKGLLG
jgi:hypothetical protein